MSKITGDKPTHEKAIDTPAGLRQIVSALRKSGRFAFDSEFVSESTFEPVLCLIQVAATGILASIDPIAIRDLTPLWELLLDPQIELVMHAAGEDLRIIKIRTGDFPSNLYDVQIAAGLVGMGYPLSLGNLVSQVLGITVAGGETRTDWRRRPLSSAQLRYALDDVRYLLAVSDELDKKLGELGRRDWAKSEMTDFLSKVERRGDEADRWRRLSGLHQLNRRGLEIARRLHDWRGDEARLANRPVKQFLRDDLLVAIAKRQPASRKDLEALRDFNRPQLMSRAQNILDLLDQARAVPDGQLPGFPERFEERPGQAMLISLLSAAMARSCAENEISTALTGSAQDIRDLVRWRLEGNPTDRTPALLQGWRRSICGETLLNVLDGRIILRVADIESDVPIHLERQTPISHTGDHT